MAELEHTNVPEVTGAYERVLRARSKDRPTGMGFINGIFTDFVELHGDRRYGDDPAIVGGLARLAGRPVTVIAIEKGTDTRERIRRNFGMAHPEGYRKAMRLMLQAEKFCRPVVCLVDTAGAYCGMGAEERGQGQAIAENIMGMLALKVPTVSIITGEGGSGGALALACADRVWMLENAAYSVITPEGCASILWKDPSRKAEAAEALGLTAEKLYGLGIVDRVIPEQPDDWDMTMSALRDALTGELSRLRELPTDVLLSERYYKYRRMGVNGQDW